MKILHITNWYPSIPTPNAAPWIKAQINSLPDEVINKVYHLEVKKGLPQILKGKNRDGSFYMIIFMPVLVWRLVEWISYRMVLWVIDEERQEDYDLINFHITYPNLTFIDKLIQTIKIPILINEHWSAYHFNFNVSRSVKLHRIKSIFKHGVPVAAVSKALVDDIRKFSSADFNSSVIPNVVDTDQFEIDPQVERETNTFLMINQWKWPKDPFSVLEAWKAVAKTNPEAKLRIGGHGPQWEEMVNMIEKLSLENVKLLGKLSPAQVAEEMKIASAFIQCSGYETFSVVCAEALCSGTPVIASKVGGITEFVSGSNGVLLTKNTPAAIEDAINKFKLRQYNYEEISQEACTRFSRQQVGNRYMQSIKKAIEAKE